MGCFLFKLERRFDRKPASLNPCCDVMFSITWNAPTWLATTVLILVVMGCFLLAIAKGSPTGLCLNPCCDGMFSILLSSHLYAEQQRLNPCCDGMFSILNDGRVFEPSGCLNPCCDGMFSIPEEAFFSFSASCLNPCCDGMFSIPLRRMCMGMVSPLS